jgi:HD superfamily phosphodiesterase
MNQYQLQIINEAGKTVTGIFQTKVSPQFVFHNLEHTRQVVDAVEEMEGYYHYQLDNNDQFVLLLSAWFHDTGFSSGKMEEHEMESIKLATDFLYRHSVITDLILQVSSCIRATHMPQTPKNLAEKILCDADLFHLGENIFHKRSGYLRHELQTYFKKEIPKDEWRQLNIDFLQSHKYFTGYCQRKLEPVKQEWIEQLRDKQETKA